MKQFILHFHRLGALEKVRIDFKSENPAKDFIELSKLDGYKMYQYIQSDYTFNMSIEELEYENIGFKKIFREKKTWFGLSKKTVTDLLIEPKTGFHYPYGYGNYLYIFTKNEINLPEFEKWLDKEFPNRFADLEDTFAGFNSEHLNLLNEDDYLIATNHDYQEQFGLSGNSSIIKKVTSKFGTADLSDYQIEEYKEERKKTLHNKGNRCTNP